MRTSAYAKAGGQTAVEKYFVNPFTIVTEIVHLMRQTMLCEYICCLPSSLERPVSAKARLRPIDRAKILALRRAQAPPPATTALRFPFLDLTPELRIYIYRLLYQRKSQIWLTGHLAHHGGGDRIETGLLLSCRKTYDEASSVLYDTNTFAVNGLAGSRYILERLGTPACSYMKRLRIWSVPLNLSNLERVHDVSEDLLRDKQNLHAREGLLLYHVAPFPSPRVKRSVWDCVSHHLNNLETIELGIFGDDFFLAVSRVTSTTRLADSQKPPPLVEIEVWANASASSLNPGLPGDAPFRKTLNSTLWLPSVKSIRLIGRLNSRDWKYLQGDVYQHYTVTGVEDMDTSEMRTAYGDDSAVLINLEMREWRRDRFGDSRPCTKGRQAAWSAHKRR